PDHPVFVQRLDGHMALANSLALRLAGVRRESRDPDGGTIVRDAAGEPTGILKDNAEELVRRAIPEPSREMNLRAARAALTAAARVGVTTIQDNSSIDALRTYQDLRARAELTARFYVWRSISSREPLEKAGLTSGLGDDWIRLGALKILSDGSMGSGTAAFFDPYTDDPGTSGLPLYPVPALARHRRHALGGAAHRQGARARELQRPLVHRRRDPRGLRHGLVRGAPRPAPRPLRRGHAGAPRGRSSRGMVPRGEDLARGGPR